MHKPSANKIVYVKFSGNELYDPGSVVLLFSYEFEFSSCLEGKGS